jgi:hypothetical protein
MTGAGLTNLTLVDPVILLNWMMPTIILKVHLVQSVEEEWK